ncbi:MAG: DUF3467 domain-containing protein [Melioribacteraceae bacterium]|nr:DUF3467 domain-containing protein [Saprospiraceae bacterium]MCF8356049.1 DUF3467 domain-containing protein [Melioribacteraceae bacterium]MCF8395516.1 DUF3467 domain-containing protein [Melioribacteraceae bacterium]
MAKKKTNFNASREDVKKETSVHAPIDKMNGVYTNVAMINHSKNEFVLDFILDVAGNANLVSRVITNPTHMKKFHQVLGDNIKKYEGNFGEIKLEE